MKTGFQITKKFFTIDMSPLLHGTLLTLENVRLL